MSNVYAYAFNRTQSVTFIADNMRNALRDIVRENGLDPSELMRQWSTWVGNAARTWLDTGHLLEIIIEFYKPGSNAVTARWDFPVSYSGSGADDMWLDKAYLRQLIAKAAKPTYDCVYRILLTRRPGALAIPGLQDTSFLSTGNLVARDAGTVIATSHMTASAQYWK